LQKVCEEHLETIVRDVGELGPACYIAKRINTPDISLELLVDRYKTALVRFDSCCGEVQRFSIGFASGCDEQVRALQRLLAVVVAYDQFDLAAGLSYATGFGF